jgi:hypothetical protein
MAEYIDKVQAMNIIASGKNDNAYFGTTDKDWEVIDFLKTVPTANVVEREKIDKAIEEMTRLLDNTNNIALENRTYDCIQILKRNMGESK